MVAKDCAVLRYSQIIADADIVPFKYSLSILSNFSLKSFIDINYVPWINEQAYRLFGYQLS